MVDVGAKPVTDRRAVAETRRLLQPGVPEEEHERAFAALWDARAATLPA